MMLGTISGTLFISRDVDCIIYRISSACDCRDRHGVGTSGIRANFLLFPIVISLTLMGRETVACGIEM